MANKLLEEKNSELLRIVGRGGVPAMKAAEELLARNDKSITGDYYEKIIESIKIRTIMTKREEAVNIIKKAISHIINGGFLDKNRFRLILNMNSELGLMSLKYQAGKIYKMQNPTIPNSILKQYIEHLPKMRAWAARKLLKQDPTLKDLMDASIFLEGDLSLEFLQKHCELGLSLKDACWYIECIPSLTEVVWEKLRQDGLLTKLSEELLEDLFRYSNSDKIKAEAARQLLPKIEAKIKDAEEKQRTKQGCSNDVLEISDLKKLSEELERFKKQELPTTKT